MAREITMVKISDERTIFIMDIDFKKSIIKYRNCGDQYDIHIPYECNFIIKDNVIHVLDNEGNSKVQIPLWMLNTMQNRINEVVAELNSNGYNIVKDDN